jgi:hypothetical protein
MTATEGLVNSNFTLFFVIFIQVCRGLFERDMIITSFLRNITDKYRVKSEAGIDLVLTPETPHERPARGEEMSAPFKESGVGKKNREITFS